MSSVGVVVLRSSAIGNAQILQKSVNNTANITNNDAKKPKREIIIVKKKQKISPQPTISVTSLVRAAENCAARAQKRPRAQDDDNEEGRSPAPLAVARRNARERNRVRQVNNGFAALRRHIPEEVADTFESANSNRGSNKKLSKVETLRMAVEYIKNLENLLNIGESSNKENSIRCGMESYPSPASSSPRGNSFERSYFSLNSPALDDDEDEDSEGPLPPLIQHQYARLPENFHLANASHLYEEEENGEPLTPASDLIIQDDLMSPHLLDANLQFMNSSEQFTIIRSDHNFGSETDAVFEDDATEIDVKYADSLRVSEIQPEVLPDDTTLLNSLDTLNPQLMIPQQNYRFEEEIIPTGNEDEHYDQVELKQELPDMHVTPEDRQQFEETLKWWQEKTKGIRPVLVNINKNID